MSFSRIPIELGENTAKSEASAAERNARQAKQAGGIASEGGVRGLRLLGFWGLGLLGFRVWGLGFRAFGVQGLGVLGRVPSFKDPRVSGLGQGGF